MSDPVTALKRLSICLRGAASLSDMPTAEREMIADGLDRYFSGSDPLDASLGVKVAPGQRDPRNRARLIERDRLVSQTAQCFFPGETQAAQAAYLHKSWLRYATTGWPRERSKASPPTYRSGKIETDLFRIMKINDGILSQRTIRLILAASYPYSLPAHADSLTLNTIKKDRQS